MSLLNSLLCIFDLTRSLWNLKTTTYILWKIKILWNKKILYKLYFMPKLFWQTVVLTYCEKKLFWRSKKPFEIQGWGSRIWKILEITRLIQTVKSQNNNLKRNAFFYLFLDVSQIYYIRSIRIQIQKNTLGLEICR